jgi:hypothetical protein
MWFNDVDIKLHYSAWLAPRQDIAPERGRLQRARLQERRAELETARQAAQAADAPALLGRRLAGLAGRIARPFRKSAAPAVQFCGPRLR